jgi:hypothetical protein
MKKIFTFFLFAFFSLMVSTSSAETIVCVPGDDIALKYLNAVDGDIIELSTDGTYIWSQRVDITVPKTITVRAAAGLSARPIIQMQSEAEVLFMLFYNLGTSSGVVTFDGLEIDGNMKTGSLVAVKCSTNYNTDVVMNNCLVKNLKNSTTASSITCFTYSNLGTGNMNPNNLTVTNSIFKFNGQGVLAASGVGRPKNVTFTNCLFKGRYVKTIGNASNQLVDLYLIDHCTFDSNNSMDVSLFGNVDLKNCIFSNSTSTGSSSTANAFGTGGNLKNHCGLFYAGAANKAFPDALLDATTIRTDPKLDANGFATAAEYLGKATDGNPIGFYEAPGLTIEANTALNEVKYLKNISVVQNGTVFTFRGVEDGACSVYSMNGSKLFAGQITNETLELTNLNRGIYLLRVNNKVLKFAVR